MTAELGFKMPRPIERNGIVAAGEQGYTFCNLLLVCTPILANDRETNTGGGDSGGPSFFGGMLVDPYIGYLQLASNGLIDVYAVPEPATLSLLLAGLGLARARARRRKA